MSKEKLTLYGVENQISEWWYDYFSNPKNKEGSAEVAQKVESLLKEWGRQCCDEGIENVLKGTKVMVSNKSLYYPKEIQE